MGGRGEGCTSRGHYNVTGLHKSFDIFTNS